MALTKTNTIDMAYNSIREKQAEGLHSLTLGPVWATSETLSKKGKEIRKPIRNISKHKGKTEGKKQ